MTASIDPDQFSRIDKIFVDRDAELPDMSLARRMQQRINFVCGPDVARSYTLQLALLTAIRIANRCFPGSVRVVFERQTKSGVVLLNSVGYPTLTEQVTDAVGYNAIVTKIDSTPGSYTVLLGNTIAEDGLRITFDGWAAMVGPAEAVPRLLEREYCSLAGVLAGALAISEIFLSFAEVNIVATNRPVGLSLWRPELNVADPAALGVPLEFLPSSAWVLGLGHLGQAYLWAFATLPYATPGDVEIFLNDYDKVIKANLETGILLTPDDVKKYKTRVCMSWLEKAGFGTRLMERPFTGDFRRDPTEPGLALCGFDKNKYRRMLETAGFDRVIECGLGGAANNFDVLNLHTLPNPRPVADLWPDEQDSNAESMAEQNTAYRSLGDKCGRALLAGTAVAVPFVGTTAAAFVIAEILRMLHGGHSYSQLKLRLGTPANVLTTAQGPYSASHAGMMGYTDAKPL